MSRRFRRPLAPVLAAFLVLAPALAGCLGPSESPGSPDAGPPDQASGSLGNGTALPTDPGGAANRSLLPAPMIWVDSGGGTLYHVGRSGNVTPLPWSVDATLTSLRWAPDGMLYGAELAGDRVVRIDPWNGTAGTALSAPDPIDPAISPVASTVLPDGRHAILDVGQGATDPTGTARADATRVLLFDAEGQPVRTWADPRFSGPVPRGNWGDIEAGPGGDLFVVTSNSAHDRTTPDDPSDDNGTGAVWRIDPDSDRPADLVASDGRFSAPDGIDVAPDGTLYVVEWVSEAPEVYRIDPSGEVSVVVRLQGADRLWGPEVLPDGRLTVVSARGAPNATEDGEGPGGIWVVDPASGEVDGVVAADGLAFPGHVRVWERTGRDRA